MNLKQCQETLQKRLKHLRQRIAASPKDLTYDKQEASALEYALKALDVTAPALAPDALALARAELAPRFVERLLLEGIRDRLLAHDFHGWLRRDREALVREIERVL